MARKKDERDKPRRFKAPPKPQSIGDECPTCGKLIEAVGEPYRENASTADTFDGSVTKYRTMSKAKCGCGELLPIAIG